MAFRSIGNISVGASGASARVAIPYKIVQDKGGQGNVAKVGNRLRLQADGADMYFKVGDASVAATSGGVDSTLLQDNAIEEFSINPEKETHIAVIGSTGNLRITVGTDSDY